MIDPKIAMLPSELPRQRIHAVEKLPPRPVKLETHVDWLDPTPTPVSTDDDQETVEVLA